MRGTNGVWGRAVRLLVPILPATRSRQHGGAMGTLGMHSARHPRPVARGACCVELALREANLPADRGKLQKLSCVALTSYQSALRILQHALKREEEVDMTALAVRLGTMRSRGGARRLLETYQERFRARLPAQRRAHADFARPTFSVVALVLQARKDKLKVDWHVACEASGVEEDDFQKVHNSMRELCYDLVGGGEKGGGASTKDKARGVKRHRELIEATDGGKGVAEGEADAGGQQRATGRGRGHLYHQRVQQTQPGVRSSPRSKAKATAVGQDGKAAAPAPLQERQTPTEAPVEAVDATKQKEASIAAARELLKAPAPPPAKAKKKKQSTLSFFKAAARAQR